MSSHKVMRILKTSNISEVEVDITKVGNRFHVERHEINFLRLPPHILPYVIDSAFGSSCGIKVGKTRLKVFR